MVTRRRRLAVASGALALLAAAITVASAASAWAHPLGAASLNRYARVEVSAEVVRVHYVIDLAEIPAYRVRRQVDADPDGYLSRQVAAAQENLELSVEGRRLELAVTDAELSRPRGDGGVRRVRIDALLEAPLPPSEPDRVLDARLVDHNQPDRVGWREIVVTAAGDATVISSSVPSADVSDALRDYPEAPQRGPLEVRTASFRFTPGSEPVARSPLEGLLTGPTGADDPLAGLMERERLTPLALVAMLGAAGLVGAGHALAPGHGKTVMAAYLTGCRGRPVDALALGLVVAGMHTASVLVLGGVLLQLDHRLDLARLYPALTLVAGVAVAAVGVWLAVVRTREWRASRAAPGELVADGRHDGEAHAPAPADRHMPAPADGHGHGRADRHGCLGRLRHRLRHSHAHTHKLPSGVAPLSRRGLVLLASSGGLVPSPSAVLVVVSAFALGRVALGLGLVLAFSLGLAATLAAVGLGLVLGSRVLRARWSEAAARAVSLVGAGVLPLLGLVLIVQGTRGL